MYVVKQVMLFQSTMWSGHTFIVWMPIATLKSKYLLKSAESF